MDSLKKVFSSKKIESPVEQIFLNELLKYDIKYELQYKVGKYRLDFALPEYKIGIEIDGSDYHNSNVQQTRDRLRDEYLEVVEGWKIKRIDAWICYRYPKLVVAYALISVDKLKNNKYFIHNKRQLAVYYAREMYNKGYYSEAKSIVENL